MPRPDGTPTIDELIASVDEPPITPRPWPPEEQCPGCPEHRDGPHKFGCSVHGARQMWFYVKREP